jgi:predicted metal-dependent phosphoesterase TrpH
VIKTELHAHTALDPVDYIPHSTRQLIDRAAALGYGALAVTLHNRFYDPAPDREYARARGIILIPGIERTLHRRHLLLLNFPEACATVDSFDDVRRLKREYPRGLVVAPHAFYPTPTAIGADADRCADFIDAVEVNAMFTPWLNFNRHAVEWARTHGKPIVGNTDLHLLEQLGTTFTLVDAPPDADAICDAIRAGRVTLQSAALPSVRAGWIFARMLGGGALGRVRELGRWLGTRGTSGRRRSS